MTDEAALREVEKRVLWLATSTVQAAAERAAGGRPGAVGGDLADAASLVTLMTALCFDALTPADRVAVTPDAAPVLHALDALLGGVPPAVTSGGADPAAAVWGALAARCARARVDGGVDVGAGGRHVAVLGERDLRQGAVWECVADPLVPGLGEVVWVVGLDRSSPAWGATDPAVRRWAGMLRAAGWQVCELMYGQRLEQLFARDGGHRLRERLDRMSGAEYGALLRAPFGRLRRRLVGDDEVLAELLEPLDDVALAVAVRDLGGHDLAALGRALCAADDGRPSVVLAATIRGCGLPIEGRAGDGPTVLTAQEYAELAESLGRDAHDPWAPLEPQSPAGTLCARVAERLASPAVVGRQAPAVPADLGHRADGVTSTQAALGEVLAEVGRAAPQVADRLVTVGARGVAEVVGADALDVGEAGVGWLLGELGAAWRTLGEPLLPLGATGDRLAAGGLDAWLRAAGTGGWSVLAGPGPGPSGARGVTTYQPAFAVEVQWCLLDALSRLARCDGASAYLQVCGRRVDQRLAAVPQDAPGRQARRRDVLAGGYRLRAAAGEPAMTVAAVGPLAPEAVTAADRLARLGVPVDVVVITSADRLWQAVQARRGLLTECGRGVDETVLDRLLRPAPLLTLSDRHASALSFLGTLTGGPVTCLGTDELEPGADDDLVVGAALDLLDLVPAAEA